MIDDLHELSSDLARRQLELLVLGAPEQLRLEGELARLGLRPPSPLMLTATEERVAALAAVGHANRQVAEALFISPKTVEASLTRVYRQLGISSRASSARPWPARSHPIPGPGGSPGPGQPGQPPGALSWGGGPPGFRS